MEPEDQEKEIEMQSEPIVIGGGAVNSVNGKTGDVVLTTSDLENDSDYQTGTEVDDAINTAVGDEATARENADNNLQEQIDDKQDTLTAGENITIENNVISAIAGGVKTLTTDDYNYPTANPDGIALWTLDEGQYIISQRTYYYTNSGGRTSTSNDIAVMVFKKAANNARGVFAVIGGATGNSNIYYSIDENGNSGSEYPFTANPINHLTSDNTKLPLAANQGRVLKELIDSLVITGAGAPTTSTTGTVGQLYEDTTNGKLYQCTAVSGGTYTWEEVGAGGGGPTVVQTTGSSTTDVMSQDATTKMVYPFISTKPDTVNIRGSSGVDASSADYAISIGGGSIARGERSVSLGFNAQAYDSGDRSVSIGNFAHVNNNSKGVAIGNLATCSNPYSIALGSNATTSRAGEVNIGAGTSGEGYNSTNYRILGGVHDGQDAHDAVTVNQVNSVIDAINTALSTNIPHIGA